MDHAFRRGVAEARRHGDLYFAGLLTVIGRVETGH